MEFSQEIIDKVKRINFSNGDVHSLYLISRIDRGIKDRKRFINTQQGRKWHKLAITLRPLRMAVLTIYMLIAFFQQPAWCIENPAVSQNPAYCNDAELNYPNSGLPKMPRLVGLLLDLLLLVALIGFKLMGRLYKLHSAHTKRFETILISLMCISIVDIMLDLIFYPWWPFPYLACYIRPVIFSITMRSLREQWKRYLFVIHDSI